MALINEIRNPDFPGGKDKYYEKSIHLILMNAPLYEPFSLYDLGNSLNLTDSDKARYRALAIDINLRKALMDQYYVTQYGSAKFNLTEYGRNYRKENDDFVPSEIIEETKHWLDNYPKSHAVYISALEKLSKKTFERNVVDDLRLSLELLVKELTGKNKSLENQIQEIGAFQKQKGVSPESTNLLSKLINYYTDYQNRYAKHDDNVNSSEVEFIFELTSVFMKFLIKDNPANL